MKKGANLSAGQSRGTINTNIPNMRNGNSAETPVSAASHTKTEGEATMRQRWVPVNNNTDQGVGSPTAEMCGIVEERNNNNNTSNKTPTRSSLMDEMQAVESVDAEDEDLESQRRHNKSQV